MKSWLLRLIMALVLAGISATLADDKVYIPVGTARTKRTVIAFPQIRTRDERSAALAKDVTETVTSDLLFMDLFSFLDASAFIEDPSKAGINAGTFKLSDW